jgi:LAO/AO transport system kinase
MPFLSTHPSAFVRPSPSRLTLGGLSQYTSDVIQLCTAAGFDMVIVETVGLGQSEVEVDQAVDMLTLLVPPAGGDELQGSKKGIVECADMIVINKADGDLLVTARHTASDYSSALKWQGTGKDDIRGKWKVPVVLSSAKENVGVDKVFSKIAEFRDTMISNGGLPEKRRRQGHYWMWKGVQEMIEKKTKEDDEMRIKADELDIALVEARITPRNAARQLMDVFLKAK